MKIKNLFLNTLIFELPKNYVKLYNSIKDDAERNRLRLKLIYITI